MTEDQSTRLTHLLAMTASPFDGEALNATRLAWEFMKEMGIDFQDVVEGRAMPHGHGARQKAYEQGYEKGYADGFREGKAAPRARPGTWQGLVREMLDKPGELTEWEEEFLESFQRRAWHTPTPRQRGVLERIANKIGIDVPEDARDSSAPSW